MRIECEFSHITITTGARHEPRHGSNPPHRPAGLAQGRDPTGLSDPAERGQLDRAGRLQLQAGHAARASARTHPRRQAWTVAAQDCLRLAQRRPLRTRPRPAATHPGHQLQPSLQVPALAKAQETQTCGASLSSGGLVTLSAAGAAQIGPHFGQVGAQLLTTDLAAGCALDVGTALDRDWPPPSQPLMNGWRLDADDFRQARDAADGVASPLDGFMAHTQNLKHCLTFCKALPHMMAFVLN